MTRNSRPEGFYTLKNDSEDDLVVVYGYCCTDAGGVFGFGFNIHDGGGFLPISDITTDTIITPIHFEKSN